jgi:hypothetical protein
MKTESPTRRAGLPLVLAVIAAAALGASGLIYAVATGNRMAVPGAAVATTAYVVLGLLAVRGHEWARWVLFALIVVTALCCTFFAFVDLGSPRARFDFTPGLALVAGLYGAIAAGLGWPTRGSAS